jgi:hypothetical protein
MIGRDKHESKTQRSSKSDCESTSHGP